MSKPQGQLKFSYDNYDDDFHQESQEKGAKNFNMQTSGVLKNQEKEENYDDDFHQQQIGKKSKVLVKREEVGTREKMIQQNIKLKTQIYELAKQMDEIMAKEKKKKNYGIHADEEEDEVIKQKKMELKRQQIEIMQLKNKIFLTKRQLQHVYDSRGIQGKQDELKALQKQLKALQSQKDGLVRIKKQQTKALKVIRNDSEYEQKISKLKEQLLKIKEQCKILSQKLIENERTLRKNHEQYITKQNKIKEMEAKIEENKNKKKSKKGQPSNIVTVEMIGEIEEQINQLEKQRKESEKSWNEKIQNIESQLHQRRMEEQKKLLILKQKEKQLKLNQIRIKELKKLIQHHNTEMNASRKQQQSQQTDMKQFRHKRNIKYLEKQ